MIVGQRDLAGAVVNGHKTAQARSQVTVSVDALPEAGPLYVSVVGRQVGDNQYRARLLFHPNGTVNLAIQKVQGSTVTTLVAEDVTDRYTPGQKLEIGFNVLGVGKTQLSATFALDGKAVQALQTDDSTAELQQDGSYGLMAYGSGRMKDVPVNVHFGDYKVAEGR